MKQVLIKKGEVIIDEVPAPMVEDGTVLVQVACSCISAGTEISGMVSSGEPLWKKAMRQPEKVMKVWDMVQAKGISTTIKNVESKLYGAMHIGYSCSGMVIEVGKDVSDIKTGDRVACAGIGYANHAEIVNVPQNLVVKVPENITLDLASTTTLGAIAMQGVRRANPTLGETVVVLGLGILGQLTAQLLSVNGCRVVGIDIDRKRVELAKSLGTNMGIYPADEDVIQKVFQFTDGFGADAAIVTAANQSNEVISQAFHMCRKKGRVVLVGDVGLNIKRSDIYRKELDFFISTSYGPGRYESNYEEGGLDYPIGYVRWTENRNMMEYLRLVAEDKIHVKPLITEEYPIEQAPEAYQKIRESTKRPLMVLLKYSLTEDQKAPKFTRKVQVISRHAKKEGRINVAIIGAGGFARRVHLPNLQKLKKDFSIHVVMSRSGTNAKAIAKQYEAAYATTDYEEVLADSSVDMVFICTRHNLHAKMVIQALKAGKHVFVEKPLCLTLEELSEIKDLYHSLTTNNSPREIYESKSKSEFHRGDSQITSNGLPMLMVGFNRRFSPYARKMKEIIKERINPMIINYRMNAGFIPKNHWVHTEEGGGRNIGEACHIYDLFNFLTDAEVESVDAKSIHPKTQQYGRNDNFIATLQYKDGSVCTLTYTALGFKDYPKEEMEVFVDGKILHLGDYKSLKVFGTKSYELKAKPQNKGHFEELKAFYEAIQNGREAIPFWQIVQATEISFEVERML